MSKLGRIGSVVRNSNKNKIEPKSSNTKVVNKLSISAPVHKVVPAVAVNVKEPSGWRLEQEQNKTEGIKQPREAFKIPESTKIPKYTHEKFIERTNDESVINKKSLTEEELQVERIEDVPQKSFLQSLKNLMIKDAQQDTREEEIEAIVKELDYKHPKVLELQDIWIDTIEACYDYKFNETAQDFAQLYSSLDYDNPYHRKFGRDKFHYALESIVKSDNNESYIDMVPKLMQFMPSHIKNNPIELLEDLQDFSSFSKNNINILSEIIKEFYFYNKKEDILTYADANNIAFKGGGVLVDVTFIDYVLEKVNWSFMVAVRKVEEELKFKILPSEEFLMEKYSGARVLDIFHNDRPHEQVLDILKENVEEIVLGDIQELDHNH